MVMMAVIEMVMVMVIVIVIEMVIVMVMVIVIEIVMVMVMVMMTMMVMVMVIVMVIVIEMVIVMVIQERSLQLAPKCHWLHMGSEGPNSLCLSRGGVVVSDMMAHFVLVQP